MHQRVLASVLLTCCVAACTRHVATPPSPAPLAPRLPDAAGLSVVLAWDAPVDLDLYLTDPTWETVYFGNNPSRTGARLLRDTRCADVATAAPFVEQAQIAEPPPGHYRIGVDFIDACGAAQRPVSFRVVAALAGERREATGTLRLAEFQPIVLEFELRRTDPGGVRSLVQEETR